MMYTGEHYYTCKAIDWVLGKRICSAMLPYTTSIAFAACIAYAGIESQTSKLCCFQVQCLEESSTGQGNKIAQPKADKCLSSTAHFSLFTCCFVA